MLPSHGFITQNRGPSRLPLISLAAALVLVSVLVLPSARGTAQAVRLRVNNRFWLVQSMVSGNGQKQNELPRNRQKKNFQSSALPTELPSRLLLFTRSAPDHRPARKGKRPRAGKK